MEAHVTMQEWTDEKHARFLNSLEDQFVRTMLEDGDKRSRRRLLDSSGSTLDSGRRTRQATDSGLDIRATRAGNWKRIMYGRSHSNRVRRPSHQQYEISQDQVVPQMENEREDEDVTSPLK